MADIFNKEVKKPAVSLYDSWVMKGVKKGLEKGLEKGKEEGMEKGKALIVKSLIGQVPMSKIAECTGFSMEQLNKIKDEVTAPGRA